MATRTDVTVVASAFDTSGNGGRKIVRLSNGWLVAVSANGGVDYKFHISKDNGGLWTSLCSTANLTGSTPYFALASSGTKVFFMHTNVNATGTRFATFDATTVTDTVQTAVWVDSSQTSFNNVSLITNESGTELHATWSSKNATYPNSFNIRYAKGTINTDGSVTWGVSEQVSTYDSSVSNLKNPTITLDKSGIPVVICDYKQGSLYRMPVFSKNNIGSVYSTTSGWYSNALPNDNNYLNEAPSAIFVPQSVNGLANGRIWVAWHGTDSVDTTQNNIRVSYSDDSGVTWSAVQKLTSWSTYYNFEASITANKSNEIFILFRGSQLTTRTNIYQVKYTGTWSARTALTNNASTTQDFYGVSTVYNSYTNFTSPLFVYVALPLTKVAFYGTWAVTTISVAEGFIGAKSDKNAFFTYAITTDGAMSTITEKLNGVTTYTRNETSGSSITAWFTTAQWDATKYGKYADANGTPNTFTIEMGTEKWTYTFDKRNVAGDTPSNALKAIQDIQTTYLPSVKAKVAEAIISKGGTASGSNPWETLINAIKTLPVKKYATGSLTVTGSYVTVSGLTFKPSFIFAHASGEPQVMYNGANPTKYYEFTNDTHWNLDNTNTYVRDTSFSLNRNYTSGGTLTTWFAIE